MPIVILNPCRKCLVRCTCKVNCSTYDIFLSYHSVIKMLIVVVTLVVSAIAIPFLWLSIIKFFKLSHDQLPGFLLVFALIIIPLGVWGGLLVVSDKLYPFDIRCNK